MSKRVWFFALLLVTGLSAVAWAVLRVQLPPADFTFVNESEIQSVDPAVISGVPEGRISWSLFEGLMRPNSETFLAEPGVAERWDLSDDGRVYTFHLRPSARWSNGDPVTAEDFAYAIRRLLDPFTAAPYAYQAWYIENAKRYSLAGEGVSPGDPLEVELNPRPEAVNTRRGELIHGRLVRIDGVLKDRTFVVETDGRERKFRPADDDDELPEGVEPCRQVMLDFRQVGVRVVDDQTLEIRLTNPTAFFLDILAMYIFSPLHRGCLEKHGAPAWTLPVNIVTNGAFTLQERRIRDHIRMRKSEMYWDRDNIRLNIVDALSIEDRTTAFNLYMTGKADWTTLPPTTALREMLKSNPPRNDLNPVPQLTTYFYMISTKRPPLNDIRVRQALSLAMDREEITAVATGGGEKIAYSLVPPNLPGYTQQECPRRDPDRARLLLAEAGYPGGLGFPKLEIHYNSEQGHQLIAELVRKQWQRELGIVVTMRNEEWASSQETQQNMDYMVSRRSWSGDYLDPNTYLDMYVTDGENNNTGFSRPEYDQLIADAGRELDKVKRMKILERAERMLMDEMPIIPIYFYVSKNMVKPYVRGWYNNLQDGHPLNTIWIDRTVKMNDPQPNEFMGRRP
jgi:oligopeptide transport system substrate-binding protein